MIKVFILSKLIYLRRSAPVTTKRAIISAIIPITFIYNNPLLRCFISYNRLGFVCCPRSQICVNANAQTRSVKPTRKNGIEPQYQPVQLCSVASCKSFCAKLQKFIVVEVSLKFKAVSWSKVNPVCDGKLRSRNTQIS